MPQNASLGCTVPEHDRHIPPLAEAARRFQRRRARLCLALVHWYRAGDKGHLSRKRARCCENRRTASTDEYRRPSEPKRIRACTRQPLWPRQESTHSGTVTL